MKHISSILLLLLLLPSCKQKCHNGVLDPGEEGIDCGGKCWSCYVDPDPSVCDNIPDMYAKLYCLYPDTTGFGVQPPPDTTNAAMFFQFLFTTTAHIIQTCGGSIANETYNSLDPDEYQQVFKYEMQVNQSGTYEFTFVEETHWLTSSNCYFYPINCVWLSDSLPHYRYYFHDMQDSIYVIGQRDEPINPGSNYNHTVNDTLVYYLLN